MRPPTLGLALTLLTPCAQRVLGVFDTVGSVGMPEELTLHDDKMKTLFGFPDRLLGHHVERAYQALALNEHRADFVSISGSHAKTNIDKSLPGLRKI